MAKKSLDDDSIHPKVTERVRMWGEVIATARRRPPTMSVQELASRIGVSEQTVKRMEAGDVKVRPASYLTAFQVFGLLEELIPIPSPALRDRTYLAIRVRRTGSSPAADDDDGYV